MNKTPIFRTVGFIYLGLVVLFFSSCSNPERELKEATAAGTDTAYSNYIKKYSNSQWAGKAQQEWEKKHFDEAKRTGTIASFSGFIAKFPNSHYNTEARTYLEEAEFTSAVRQAKLEIWTSFIQHYPQSSFRPKVLAAIEKLEFDVAFRLGTNEALSSVMARYPNNERLGEAQRRIEENEFQNAISRNSSKNLKEFLSKYPKSKKRETALYNLGITSADATEASAVLESWLREFPESTLRSAVMTKLAELSMPPLLAEPNILKYNAFIKRFRIEALPKTMQTTLSNIKRDILIKELGAERVLVLNGVEFLFSAKATDNFGGRGKITIDWRGYDLRWALKGTRPKTYKEPRFQLYGAKGEELNLPGTTRYLENENIDTVVIPKEMQAYVKLVTETEASELIELP